MYLFHIAELPMTPYLWPVTHLSKSNFSKTSFSKVGVLKCMISVTSPPPHTHTMIWRCLHGWWDRWTLESGVMTFHLIHHPVMDMGSQSVTGWEDRRGWRVQMGLRVGLERDLGRHSMVASGTRGGLGGGRVRGEAWPGLRSGMYNWGN